MTERIDSLRSFVEVARTGSFSQAAMALGISQPAVTRAIVSLERHVGAALLTRTTRAVSLTAAGSGYLARVEPLLVELEEARHQARGGIEVCGSLRAVLPVALGQHILLPRLASFMSRHPALRIAVFLEDSPVDLVKRSIDIALRFGALADTSAVARRLASWQRVVVASPAYLARRGTPRDPADLRHHAVIAELGAASTGLELRQRERVAPVLVDGRLSVSTSDAHLAVVRAGLGIGVVLSPYCSDDLASGALVKVLSEWEPSPVELHAVMPAGRASSAAARAFVAFTSDELERTGRLLQGAGSR